MVGSYIIAVQLYYLLTPTGIKFKEIGIKLEESIIMNLFSNELSGLTILFSVVFRMYSMCANM